MTDHFVFRNIVSNHQHVGFVAPPSRKTANSATVSVITAIGLRGSICLCVYPYREHCLGWYTPSTSKSNMDNDMDFGNMIPSELHLD